jgi:hypothetical protein
MLHEKIAAKLVAKICAEQKAIENRLRLLVKKSERRPYPIVLPKFINPAEPSQVAGSSHAG